MSKQDKDQSVEKLLSEMPNISDDKSFDEYYQNISKEIHIEEPKKNKRNWLFSVITTAAALCLAIIIGYQFIVSNETADQIGVQHNESSSFDAASNDHKSSEAEAEGEVEQFSEQSEEEAGIMESSAPRLLNEEQVVSTKINTATLMIPGPAAQYFVPLTYFIPENKDPYSFFNQQSEIVEHEELKSNLIDYISYVGTNSRSEPIVQVDESQLQGSASELALSESLSYFQSLGHDQIQLQDTNGEPLDLPHTGTVDRFTFDNPKYVYKLFETNRNMYWARKRLGQSASLEESFNELKIDEKNLDIMAPVPKHFKVSFTENNTILEINVQSDLALNKQESTQRVIEALLLTAGSFGYEQVQFINMNKNQIGPYDLTQPINIPEYINVQ